MAKGRSEKSRFRILFNQKLIRRGVILFTAISLITLTAIFIYTNTGKTLEVWSQIDWRFLGLAVVFVLMDLYLGGMRNHIFVKEYAPRISQWISFKANLANIFMGAVTPSQTGGGLAQWYLYYRNGLSIADNISISFFNWISTIVFFPVSGAMALYILQDKVPKGFITHLTQFGFSAFFTVFIVVMLALFAPRVIGRFVQRIAKTISSLSRKWGERMRMKSAQMVVKMLDHQKKYVLLLKTRPHLLPLSFILTILLYFNKYALAYILILAFGAEADFWTVIAIQAVVYLVLYFAPSPGGSGIAEISITGLMASVLSNDYLASFTLLYRSFLVFIPALLGSYILLHQVSKEGKKNPSISEA